MFVLYHPGTKQSTVYAPITGGKVMTVGTSGVYIPIEKAREKYRALLNLGFVRVDENPHVSIARSTESTHYVATGTHQALCAWKARLLKMWPVLDFQTAVTLKAAVTPGVRVATARHFNR